MRGSSVIQYDHIGILMSLSGENERPVEERLFKLEKQVGYRAFEISPDNFNLMVGDDIEGPSFVDWGDTSGYVTDFRHSYGAAVCFSGIVFRLIDEVFQPNLFHFMPDQDDKSLLRSELGLTSDSKIYGIVGTEADQIETELGKFYTEELGLIPIKAPRDYHFNVAISPATKQIFYAFEPNQVTPHSTREEGSSQ